MKTFYVFAQDKEWVVVADACDISHGHLVFFKEKMLIKAFNSDHWDAVTLAQPNE